ncbi:MAG TPA: hypothetical protein VFH47_00060 [Candidatus Thermoplasmatota archaeon]|nr:hypothetical protein [Candidatus Thermoplasmatota archaeon]
MDAALLHVATAALLAASAGALAGCTEDAGMEPGWTLRGHFTAGRTDADIDDLRARVESRGGTVAILESFPEQFVASRLSAASCDALHAELSRLPYLEDVRSCSPAAPAS